LCKHAGHIMRVVLASLGQRWIGPFGPFGPFGRGAVRECADGAGRGFCFRRSRQLAWASRWCCRRCPRSNGSNGSNGSNRSIRSIRSLVSIRSITPTPVHHAQLHCPRPDNLGTRPSTAGGLPPMIP
jgi:hypothetical protein